MDSFVPAKISLGVTHHLYPEYYLFGTEACSGWSQLDRGVKLGSWDRAEQYAHDIIEVRSSWLTHLSSSCSARFTLTNMWFQGESPPSMLQCRLTSCSLLHTLGKLPAGYRSKLELFFVAFFISFKGNSLHSVDFTWVHSDSSHLEHKEELIYVHMFVLWLLSKTPGTN